MKRLTICVGVAMAIVQALAAFAQDESPSPGETIVAAIQDLELATVLGEVLERNPEAAAARARAAAAAQRAPQVSSLPDPVAAFTLYLQTPETRVGPQYGTVSVMQRIPWFGTLGVREQVAVAEAAAASSDADAVELDQVTRARVLLHELAFLDVRQDILRNEGETLEHFEELAQARYASGVGLGQAVIKIQAEIARNEAAVLELRSARSSLVANLNALRDRAGAPVPPAPLPRRNVGPLDQDHLRTAALAHRPEVAAARARLAAAEQRVDLADKSFGPDLSAGIIYSAVGSRTDADPPDNGQDVFGITGGVSLPVRRKRLHAGMEEAVQARLAAEEQVRATQAAIAEEMTDLTRRIPLIDERLALFDNVLVVQAEESLLSAFAAYSAGTVGALDLLDAERVLFEVRVAAARAQTDLANAIARLERAVAQPVMEGAS